MSLIGQIQVTKDIKRGPKFEHTGLGYEFKYVYLKDIEPYLKSGWKCSEMKCYHPGGESHASCYIYREKK